MNSNELQSLILSGQPCLLINVLPAEVHSAMHIAGSSNVCVYETAFLDQVAALSPDRACLIVVYGYGEESLDARVAKEKLKAAGYGNVMELSPGISGWKQAGFPVRGSGQVPREPVPDGRYRVDTAESVVRWTGRNLFNHHHGTVGLSSGEFLLSHGRLVLADFSIDMRSIACDDISDPPMNALLVRHLWDADFFDVERHPVARFEATQAISIDDASAGTPNYVLHGIFTLRGITKPLEFPVVIASADGKRITGQGMLEMNRTEFGSIYGSGRFFKFLGRHVVNDHVHLHVKIHADAVSPDRPTHG